MNPVTRLYTPCLWEPATMTLRITLLVLATGLFSLIWINDRQAPLPASGETAAIARRADKPDQPTATNERVKIWRRLAASWKRSYRPMGHAARRYLEEQLAEVSLRFQDRRSGETRVATASAEEPLIPEMPLPLGILPGEYRAVSHTGIVIHFTLTEEQLKGRGDFIAQDVYRSQSAKLRWYFIRVQPETAAIAPAVAERHGQRILPAIAERSRSERIQKQAGQIILRAGQTIMQRMAAILENRQPASQSVRSLLTRPLRISNRDAGKQL